MLFPFVIPSLVFSSPLFCVPDFLSSKRSSSFSLVRLSGSYFASLSFFLSKNFSLPHCDSSLVGGFLFPPSSFSRSFLESGPKAVAFSTFFPKIFFPGWSPGDFSSLRPGRPPFSSRANPFAGFLTPALHEGLPQHFFFPPVAEIGLLGLYFAVSLCPFLFFFNSPSPNSNGFVRTLFFSFSSGVNVSSMLGNFLRGQCPPIPLFFFFSFSDGTIFFRPTALYFGCEPFPRHNLSLFPFFL